MTPSSPSCLPGLFADSDPVWIAWGREQAGQSGQDVASYSFMVEIACVSDAGGRGGLPLSQVVLLLPECEKRMGGCDQRGWVSGSLKGRHGAQGNRNQWIFSPVQAASWWDATWLGPGKLQKNFFLGFLVCAQGWLLAVSSGAAQQGRDYRADL